jgi:predicted Rossmann-fold nucleotide-binding protein
MNDNEKRIQTVVVYCGSSVKADEKYFKVAEILGKVLAENQIKIVYGGNIIL